MEEIWKDVKGYEGCYQISNLGRVKSLSRISAQGKPLKERILIPDGDKRGYQQVTLWSGGIKERIKIHRLVAIHFVNNDKGYDQVNHIDENKLNNNSNNLEWCNQMYNNLYNGRHKRIGKKLEKPLIAIGYGSSKEYPSGRIAAKELNINEAGIYRCLRKEQESYKGYVFKHTNRKLIQCVEYESDGPVGTYDI